MFRNDPALTRHLTLKKTDPLGEGAQAKVHKVHCKEFNTKYAMKCIKINLDEAKKEAETLLKLDHHDNIVQYIGYLEAEVDGFKVGGLGLCIKLINYFFSMETSLLNGFTRTGFFFSYRNYALS